MAFHSQAKRLALQAHTCVLKSAAEDKRKIIIIGGGPASLALACWLDKEKFEIHIYEKNTALGRKFLVAGKGGFNLTHSEPIEELKKRYIPQSFLANALDSFSNSDFRAWLKEIGIDTYIGTSKRVFPVKGIKPIEVLKAIEKKLVQNHVTVHYEHEWIGFGTMGQLLFSTKKGIVEIAADVVVFALGGKSWKVTGSNGEWLNYFAEKVISTKEFFPSNCAFKVEWNKELVTTIEGTALKNCEFKSGENSHKGEAILTSFGIEGSGVYPLSNEIRKQLAESGSAVITIDMKPGVDVIEIEQRIARRAKLNIKEVLVQKINLTDIQAALIKSATTKEQYNDAAYLANLVKAFSVTVAGLAPIDEAISTVGGISLDEVKENFELKKMPQHYCIGEMLDWDAPTGGYLLQGCFSMGVYLSKMLNDKF